MPSSTVTDELTGVVAQAALVQYQPGAIVSRTLVKTPGGTVTAFAFAAGEGLSEHSAPFDALVLAVEGEAEITISGQPHHVQAGDLLKLPAREPHAVRTTAPFKMILVMIKA
ncbi:MAG TPA: cupin domain-containing protein [Candidatus Kryptonia bacterium]|nr:cupin domain-containing protein [Candidatus Kryptonia bacterium]